MTLIRLIIFISIGLFGTLFGYALGLGIGFGSPIFGVGGAITMVFILFKSHIEFIELRKLKKQHRRIYFSYRQYGSISNNIIGDIIWSLAKVFSEVCLILAIVILSASAAFSLTFPFISFFSIIPAFYAAAFAYELTKAAVGRIFNLDRLRDEVENAGAIISVIKADEEAQKRLEREHKRKRNRGVN